MPADIPAEVLEVLHAQIEARWQQMLALALAGDDIPPGLRLRTEGLMEALVLLGYCDAAQLQASMAAAFEATHGRELADVLGADWARLHPFPEIPFFMQRAPVYPSTRE